MTSTSKPGCLKDSASVSETETPKTPLEYESLAKLKCTAVIRMLDFLTVLLQDGEQSSNLLEKHCLWTVDLFQLIVQCVMDPVSVGFEIRDTEVSRHLPLRLEEVLKVMKAKLPQQVSAALVSHLQESLKVSQFDKMLVSPLAEFADVSLKTRHVIEGLEILQRSGWLQQCSVVCTYI